MIVDKLKQCITNGDLQGAIRCIVEARTAGEDLQGLNIRAANILVNSWDWDMLNILLPSNTNYLQTSGWLRSLREVRPLNVEGEAIPWFTYPSIEFLNNIVDKDWIVFEWGSGNSTHWWSKRVAKVTAIEDDKKWYEIVCKSLPPNVDLHFKSGDDYAASIQAYPQQSFDVIVIDGSDRNQCAKACIQKLKDKGIIIFDNSDMN